MAKTKIILMSCPAGHSFITLQRCGHTFTCTECNLSFESWLRGPGLSEEACGPGAPSSAAQGARKIHQL